MLCVRGLPVFMLSVDRPSILCDIFRSLCFLVLLKKSFSVRRLLCSFTCRCDALSFFGVCTSVVVSLFALIISLLFLVWRSFCVYSTYFRRSIFIVAFSGASPEHGFLSPICAPRRGL